MCMCIQARLQQYAERVAALEILNMNYKSQENEEDENGAGLPYIHTFIHTYIHTYIHTARISFGEYMHT